MNSNVALLVDGDNISHRHASALLKLANKSGERLISHVFGDVTNLPKWEEQSAFRLIHAGANGKNATDMLLAINAIEMSHSHDLSTFVLATSDGDFRHLAHHFANAGLRLSARARQRHHTNFATPAHHL